MRENRRKVDKQFTTAGASQGASGHPLTSHPLTTKCSSPPPPSCRSSQPLPQAASQFILKQPAPRSRSPSFGTPPLLELVLSPGSVTGTITYPLASFRPADHKRKSCLDALGFQNSDIHWDTSAHLRCSGETATVQTLTMVLGVVEGT